MPLLDVLKAACRFNRSIGDRRDYRSLVEANIAKDTDVYSTVVEPYKDEIDPDTGETLYNAQPVFSGLLICEKCESEYFVDNIKLYAFCEGCGGRLLTSEDVLRRLRQQTAGSNETAGEEIFLP